ncbi:MAG TPA: hypothetical protein VFK78_12290 [Gemmatimonadales bacterium]|nr:hypothetical protein [Gemmatimonadales bacterium]
MPILGRSLLLPTAGALLLASIGCNRRQTVAGECRAVHGAQVCTWGETMAGQVVAFGATIPVMVADSAPADMKMAWPPVADAVIPLPAAVAQGTGFSEMTIFWEPHGHPPGAYLTPHFDFHFYGVPAAAVDAIDCADSTKPAALAAGYALPDADIPGVGHLVGICVPKMGMHALPAAELASANIFEKTMVVGYYHASPIFVEPMITQATLAARKSFTLPLLDVPGRPAGTKYPTSFRADYDSTAKAYRFVFEGMGGK